MALTREAGLVLQAELLPGTREALDRLPGTRPLNPADWLVTDDAHAGQMALRDALIAERRREVVALDEGARDAASEMLDVVLGALAGRPGYASSGDAVRRPDGVAVPTVRDDPLGTLGRLVQEDLCLLQKRGEEHLLTGAVLCFPSRWLLAEKFMRPLVRIHEPVEHYDADVARRVQRLFDGVRPGRPLWRANLVKHWHAELFQPLSEAVKDRRDQASAPYLRSERQCILRLPETGAVVFSIHTTVVRAAAGDAARRGR